MLECLIFVSTARVSSFAELCASPSVACGIFFKALLHFRIAVWEIACEYSRLSVFAGYVKNAFGIEESVVDFIAADDVLENIILEWKLCRRDG